MFKIIEILFEVACYIGALILFGAIGYGAHKGLTAYEFLRDSGAIMETENER